MDMLLDNHVALVVAIFLARVVDVSLGTLRTILILRGHKLFAALIGFFEVLVWVVAASKVLENLDTWYLAVAYAGGFAAGTVVGVYLEQKLAIGVELVRTVSKDPSIRLGQHLAAEGFDVIELVGNRNGAPVEVLLVVEQRRHIPTLLRSIDRADPGAYYTISAVQEMASQYTGVRPRVGRPPPSTPRK